MHHTAPVTSIPSTAIGKHWHYDYACCRYVVTTHHVKAALFDRSQAEKGGCHGCKRKQGHWLQGTEKLLVWSNDTVYMVIC